MRSRWRRPDRRGASAAARLSARADGRRWRRTSSPPRPARCSRRQRAVEPCPLDGDGAAASERSSATRTAPKPGEAHAGRTERRPSAGPEAQGGAAEAGPPSADGAPDGGAGPGAAADRRAVGRQPRPVPRARRRVAVLQAGGDRRTALVPRSRGRSRTPTRRRTTASTSRSTPASPRSRATCSPRCSRSRRCSGSGWSTRSRACCCCSSGRSRSTCSTRRWRGVRRALERLHERVLGQAWFLAAISVAGLWAIWRGLVQGRAVQTLAGLASTVGLMVVALVLIANPTGTVGHASKLANEGSLGLLSAASTGSTRTPERSFARSSERLFSALVVSPWCALQFGDVQLVHRPPQGRAAQRGPVAGLPRRRQGARGDLQAHQGRGGRRRRPALGLRKARRGRPQRPDRPLGRRRSTSRRAAGAATRRSPRRSRSTCARSRARCGCRRRTAPSPGSRCWRWSRSG